jgi:uncharacterized protein YjiS (DUF1127 family)
MSQSVVQQPPRARGGAGTGLHLARRWLHAIEIQLNRRQGRQDLSLLDDRLLKDIGVSREQALRKAREPTWWPGTR